jgi:hypothetical protein
MAKQIEFGLTVEQVVQFREDARAAGDYRTSDICDVALAAFDVSDADGRDLAGPDGQHMSRTEARQEVAEMIAAANAAEA